VPPRVKTSPQKSRSRRQDKITEPLPYDDPFESIRRRAYEIWEASGRPDGQHLDHWRQAEIEWSARSAEADVGTSAPATKPRGKQTTPKSR
jgi:DUF2934 family protein